MLNVTIKTQIAGVKLSANSYLCPTIRVHIFLESYVIMEMEKSRKNSFELIEFCESNFLAAKILKISNQFEGIANDQFKTLFLNLLHYITF